MKPAGNPTFTMQRYEVTVLSEMLRVLESDPEGSDSDAVRLTKYPDGFGVEVLKINPNQRKKP